MNGCSSIGVRMFIQIVCKDEKGFIRQYAEFDPDSYPDVKYQMKYYIQDALNEKKITNIEIKKRDDL